MFPIARFEQLYDLVAGGATYFAMALKICIVATVCRCYVAKRAIWKGLRQRWNKALHPTASIPFVPRYTSTAGELSRCSAVRRLGVSSVTIKIMNKRETALFLIPASLLLMPSCLRLQRQYFPLPKTQKPPVYQPQSGPVPRFVTYHLAGQNLLALSKFADKCDPNSDYCITGSAGPDGCEFILELSNSSEYRRRFSVSHKEMKQRFKGVHLPLLTGGGVRIGDTPEKVRQEIGVPTEEKGLNGALTTYEYIHHGKKRFYGATYRFYRNKLISINFRDARAPDKNIPVIGCP
jgi:hypothetical protein